jgi:cell division protein FtsL
MQKERAAEAEVARHLRLEIETLRSPVRIERLATGRLHMVAPGPEDAAVIERVIPASPPPRSVVARR